MCIPRIILPEDNPFGISPGPHGRVRRSSDRACRPAGRRPACSRPSVVAPTAPARSRGDSEWHRRHFRSYSRNALASSSARSRSLDALSRDAAITAVDAIRSDSVVTCRPPARRPWPRLKAARNPALRAVSCGTTYLDVIAPDETPTQEIQNAVMLFIAHSRGRPLPWIGTIGRCTFRFGVELGLYTSCAEEFRRLLFSALSVRRAA